MLSLYGTFKGVVHLKKKKMLIIYSPPSKMSMSFFLSVKNKLRFLIKTFQDFSPYNALQWEPNGSRSNSFSANCSKDFKRFHLKKE